MEAQVENKTEEYKEVKKQLMDREIQLAKMKLKIEELDDEVKTKIKQYEEKEEFCQEIAA